jgi:uncharacterized repeat protein (TIGR03803 family)
MNTRALKILAVSLGLCAAAGNLVAQVTVTNLYSFGSIPNDGGVPYAGLVQGSDGNFYGTTSDGGAGDYGYGTVFKISPRDVYTSFYSFGSYLNDGFDPQDSLVQGSDGNFYGTTYAGGTNGDGTVFRVSPETGIETNLYSFGSNTNDGTQPVGGLVQGSDGNFYGTTSDGGTNSEGTVFRISPGGVYTNLYSFVGGGTSGNEEAGLVQGSDGNFYGTTAANGAYNDGIIFRISPGGIETNLYSFGGYYPDGYDSQAPLVEGSDGNFYGTTKFGGTNDLGTVFRISPGGSYTNLYSFAGYPTDGNEPYAGLVQGSDGNFYGTTYGGGTNYNNYDGTVFRISPGGSFSNLYSFTGNVNNDGQYPLAPLVQGSDGNFYGTTEAGGMGDGNVFRLTVPLNPPANQITSVRVAATNVILTIASIAGETYQLQSRYSLNSGSWANIPGASITNSIGSILTVTNFGGFSQSRQFYRFVITP